MKKILALSICLLVSAFSYAGEDTEYTMQVVFTVKTRSNNAEDIELVKAPFEQLIDLTQTDEDPLFKLLERLQEAFRNIPNICKQQGVHGSITCEINMDDNVTL